ncbi:hypothetical protein CFP56_016459 [Quercus suber]|uniref:Uncharacterized protein n=1 Tax=Quercus suber TaxID=58331 RepID=A0AAW0KQ92_QUESU
MEVFISARYPFTGRNSVYAPKSIRYLLWFTHCAKNPLVEELSSQYLKTIKGERCWWESIGVEQEWSRYKPGNSLL